MRKTIAFQIAYLLGVEESVLKRDYEEDYDNSKELELFDNYKNAYKLRSLLRFRQSAIRYYYLYELENKVLSDITNNYFKKEAEYLLKEGIDVEEIYSTKGHIAYINALTEEIDKIKLGVLKELEVPRSEIIVSYFYFPKFTPDSFYKFQTSTKSLACPHGIILYKGSKLDQSLSFSLLDNKNLYNNIYMIRGEKCDKKIDMDIEYIWRHKKSSEVIKGVKPTTLKKLKGIDVPHMQDEMLNFLKQEGTEIFVDCDNADFFKFLNFIRAMEAHKVLKNIKLIVDKKSNFLWKVFKELYTGKVPVDIVQVQRIKDNKSVADIVLTKEICEGYYKRGLNRVLIVSSDSDFYGIITSLPEIKYGVAYTKNQINDDYLTYLQNNDILAYSLADFDTVELLNFYKDICIEYILIYTLANTPMSKWYSENIKNIVEFYISKETDIEIEDGYIEKHIKTLWNNIEITIENDITYIKVKDIKINTMMI